MGWILTPSLDRLRRNVRTVWGQGITVYTIGDDAHKLRRSDHNADDTPGSLAEQSDSDSTPEVRAIDIMLGASFTKANALALIAAMRKYPKRFHYIIFDHKIYRNDGTIGAHNTDPHEDHVHVSGLPSDDANTADWPAVLALATPTPPEEPDMTPEQDQLLKATNERVKSLHLGLASIKTSWAANKDADEFNALAPGEPVDVTLSDAQLDTLASKVAQLLGPVLAAPRSITGTVSGA